MFPSASIKKYYIFLLSVDMVYSVRDFIMLNFLTFSGQTLFDHD